MCVCVCEWGGEGHTHTHTTKGGLTFGSCGLSVECLQLYLFPRELPNHTSYPSLKMQYAKLSRVHNLKADNSTPVLRNAHRSLFWLFIHLSSTHLSLSLSRPLSLSLDLSRPLSTSLSTSLSLSTSTSLSQKASNPHSNTHTQTHSGNSVSFKG